MARPKTPAEKRFAKVADPYFRSVLAGRVPAPQVAAEYLAADAARDHGKSRRRGTTYDWQSVIDLLIAAGKTHVLNGEIRADSVRSMLLTIEQTKDVRAAKGDYYRTFIQWVRRGIDSKELQLPPPQPPAVFVSTDEDDPENM